MNDNAREAAEKIRETAEDSVEAVGEFTRTLWQEAQKRPGTAAAIGIGIGAVAAAVLFAGRRRKKEPHVPTAYDPQSD